MTVCLPWERVPDTNLYVCVCVCLCLCLCYVPQSSNLLLAYASSLTPTEQIQKLRLASLYVYTREDYKVHMRKKTAC
jgi:hypothetical protein